ncbi:MAG TPA: hypothetical protein VGE37_14390, partial [Archangium sp.]
SGGGSGQDGGTDAGLLGDTWRPSSPLTPNDFYFSEVISTPTGLLAVGGRLLQNNALLARSVDGESWTVQALPTDTAAWESVAFDGQRFVAVGLLDGARARSEAWFSTDGMNWQQGDAGMGQSLRSVQWDGTRFWTVGQGGVIAESTDGIDWVRRDAGTTATLFDIAFHGGRSVAVGSAGTVLTSTDDGLSWQPTDAGTNRFLASVALDGNRFIAVGESGTVLTSDDGLSWTARPSGTSLTLRSVLAFDGGIVAVGDRGVSTPSPVIVSRNAGATWTLRPTGVNQNWSGVTELPGKLIVVGSEASVILSP